MEVRKIHSEGLVFSLSRLFGLTLFSAQGDLTLCQLVRFLTLAFIVLGLTGYLVLSGNFIMIGPDTQLVEMQVATNVIQFPLMALASLLSAGLAARKHRSLRSALSLLAHLRPSTPSYWHSVPSLVFFTQTFLYDLCRSYQSTRRILTLLSYFIPLFIIILVESQFTYGLNLVKHQYIFAVKCLPMIRANRLRQLVIKVRMIDKACILINHTYTASLLLIFGAFFSAFISETYYFLTSIVSYSKHDSTINIFSLFSFLNTMALIIFEIWKITWFSSTTKRQISIFNKKLYGLCLLDESHNFCKNIWIQTHFYKQKDVTISAFNFFNIELPILQSMLGAAATYLVIMLQFQLSNS